MTAPFGQTPARQGNKGIDGQSKDAADVKHTGAARMQVRLTYEQTGEVMQRIVDCMNTTRKHSKTWKRLRDAWGSLADARTALDDAYWSYGRDAKRGVK